MKRLAYLAIDVLATYRITKLVLEDEILSGPRDKLLAKYPPNETKFGYLLTCPWCVSVWAGMGVVGLRMVAPKIGEVVSSGLAASALTGEAYERL